MTTVARTLIDLTSILPRDQLRRALAEAEYRRRLEMAALEDLLQRGRPGSAALREAIRHHLPELARTFSVLEQRFLELCESAGFDTPEVNARVAGLVVDALWRDRRVIVELDGHAAHGSPAAAERDRRRELALRDAGFTVLRYTWAQITREPELVVADLRAALEGGRAALEGEGAALDGVRAALEGGRPRRVAKVAEWRSSQPTTSTVRSRRSTPRSRRSSSTSSSASRARSR